MLELGRAKIAGGRVDQVADKRGRLSDADGGVDPRRIAGDQNARTGAGFGLVRSIGVEAVLGYKRLGQAQQRLLRLPGDDRRTTPAGFGQERLAGILAAKAGVAADPP